MINYGDILNLLDYLPAVNTLKGLFFYTFIVYVMFLITLRITHKSDQELEKQIENEQKSFNKKLEELRKIKDKEAKEILANINKFY